MKYINLLYKTGLTVGLVSTIITFILFYKNINKLETLEEWKYYASLTGFIIFFFMFLLLIFALILKSVLKK